MASGKSFEKIGLTHEKHLKLQYLTDLELVVLLRVNDNSMSVMKMALNQRDSEIFKCTAEGKISANIPLILDISENSVNFHQKRCKRGSILRIKHSWPLMQPQRVCSEYVTTTRFCSSVLFISCPPCASGGQS